MSCKLAPNSAAVQAVRWRQISAGVQAPSETPGSANAAELERQIRSIQASHQSELTEVRRAAFDDGLRQGREQAAAAVKEAAERLATTLADLSAYKRKLRMDAEREVVKLSVAIARRILNRELATDPDALEGLVHAALAKLQARDVWHVRVPPSALQTTLGCIERAGVTANVNVVADASLQTGDLLIDTPAGELDASVRTQLQEIERGFAERLGIR